MSEPMKLTADEKTKLEKAKTETDFYKICDQVKARRNGAKLLSNGILPLPKNRLPSGSRPSL